MNQTGVSQKVLIFNKKGELLTIRRTKTAPTRPLCWDFPGGDVDFGENAITGIHREIKEETGLEVKNLTPFDVESHINKKGDFWITIAYKAVTLSDKVVLSYEHDKIQWLSPQKFLKLKSAPKLKRFVKNFPK